MSTDPSRHRAGKLAPKAAFQNQGQRAYEQIRQMITAGTLSPEQRMTLMDLAKRLGMSIIPVRDALRQLEYDGLLERAGAGSYHVQQVSLERVVELSILREALEVQAARLCAERIAPEQLDELRRLGGQIDQLVKGGRRAESIDWERQFHERVAEIAGYGELLSAIRRLQLVLCTFPIVVKSPRSSHGALVDALASRNPQRAEDAFRHHVRSRRRKIQEGGAELIVNGTATPLVAPDRPVKDRKERPKQRRAARSR